MFRKDKTFVEDGGENGDYLDPTETTATQRRGSAVAHDAVFGEITEDGPNYRAVSQDSRSFWKFTERNRSDGKAP